MERTKLEEKQVTEAREQTARASRQAEAETAPPKRQVGKQPSGTGNAKKQPQSQQHEARTAPTVEAPQAPPSPLGDTGDIPDDVFQSLDKVDLPLDVLMTLEPEGRQKIFYALLIKAETMLKMATTGSRDAAINYFAKAAMLVPSPLEVLNAYQTTLDQETFVAVVQKFQEVNIKKAFEYMDECVKGQDWFKFEMEANEYSEVPVTWVPRTKQVVEANREIFVELPDVAWHCNLFEVEAGAGTTEGGEQSTAALQASAESVDRDSLLTPESAFGLVAVEAQDAGPKAGGDSLVRLCDNCHVKVSTGSTIKCPDCVSHPAYYCSPRCKSTAGQSFHFVTCTKDGAVLDALGRLHDYVKETKSVMPLIMLRYLSILLSEELKGNSSAAGGPFLHFDHLSRVIVVETAMPSDIKEATMLRSIFAIKDQNMSSFLQDQVYASMKATVQANAYVSHPGGKLTRMPKNGIQEPRFGMIVGLYHTLSHVPHSCDPNCEMVMNERDHLVLRARREIGKGQSLTVAYPGCEGAFTEMEVEGRGKVLKAQYGLDCSCTKCSS